MKFVLIYSEVKSCCCLVCLDWFFSLRWWYFSSVYDCQLSISGFTFVVSTVLSPECHLRLASFKLCEYLCSNLCMRISTSCLLAGSVVVNCYSCFLLIHSLSPLLEVPLGSAEVFG